MNDLYRYKVKKPLPDWSFFENFYKLSLEGKLGKIKALTPFPKIISKDKKEAKGGVARNDMLWAEVIK